MRILRALSGLTWRLLRGGGVLGPLLTMAAVALSTGLLLFAVGANHAFAERADADAWRAPAKATGTPTAIQAKATDSVRGRPLTIVDLAALSDRAPVPPGMKRFPAPGETWVSPALAELMRELPADQLAKRFGGAPAGTLGRDALEHPDELVAVAGHTADDPAMKAERPKSGTLDTIAGPERIDAYATGAVTTRAQTYRILMYVASVLMVVPLLVFGGAAARLTVARRDRRLAALRLVGATPGQVVAITTAEAVLTAAAGAVLGTLLYAAAIPALARVRIAGGGWYAADLWPGLLPLLGVLAAVPLLVGASAVAGLRRVVISPLGVAQRHTPPGMRAVRAVALVVLIIAFGILGGGVLRVGEIGAIILLVFLSLAFLALNFAGPWVVWVLGHLAAATVRRPAGLLAGRRLIDDPRSAWRMVAGVALTGFVAGFLALLNPGAVTTGPADRLELAVPKERSAAVAAQARERLDGLPAKVTVTPREGNDIVAATVTGGEASVDRARTALAGTVPGKVATAPADMGAGTYLLADLRTGSLTVLIVSFLIAVASAGITGAGSVLDRRQTYEALRLAGTPLPVLDRARRQEVLIPLAVMGGGSMLTGLFFAFPFASGLGSAGTLTLLAATAVGFAGVLGASALSRPLLRSVTGE
ncbi:FtsX-like permease family protein [Spirillospora sp. NPDC029432]|uniref:FtsX-like permease family protein n=1 Tax=Spirillospora sp. NPDC029432 TaxID=3154599 RepID=UPI003451374F